MITQWFDPEPTFKGLLFAQELIRQGHDVEVVTGYPNYPGGKLYDGYTMTGFRREVVGGVRVLRVPLYPSHDGSAVKRIANYVSFAAAASVGVLAMGRPDVAYVYHPPATVCLPAVVLKALKGVPYVYDVQDLWPDTLAATGMLTHPRALAIVGRFMKGVYSGAARIAVLSDGFREALSTRGVPRSKVEVIHNWADEAQIDVSVTSDKPAEDLGFGDDFIVTFAGNLGKAQGLESVLDAAGLLREKTGLRFVFVGGGLEAENLQREARRRGLANVTFLPRRPISEMGNILTRSDALLVHLRDEPLFEITIPSKTQAYLMAGRPILMAVRGDAARLVECAGAGKVFEPESPAQLADAVTELMSLTPEARAELGRAGARFYQEKLSLKVGAARFGEVLRTASLSKPWVLGPKRLGDIVVSGAALVLFSVPIGVIAIAVRLKLGRPVIFRQLRPGRHGEPFEMIKFRTMTDKRDASGTLLSDAERLTSFGRLLRSTSADELPSLWNVLRGDMSLVGPRPLLLRYTEYFTDEESIRLHVRPGITGLAQINGRNTASWDSRLADDVTYVENLSLALDLRILCRTVARVFRRSGVVEDPESLMANLDVERSTARTKASVE
ncbi:glycosyltransferase [Diaminobutyricibacter tongyongensis]|uniref:Glycosyltransferase n=1 Tax=Leifsonia tongyongensis TaxID=1268043 RepID=A0A6L9XVP8_9MICO|nr:sugar transferase [Diaminobutyricibacter tongyongensis]NEN05463.1 glycosyltransferase [Diaminobutyricibacter tongyongensis]